MFLGSSAAQAVGSQGGSTTKAATNEASTILALLVLSSAVVVAMRSRQLAVPVTAVFVLFLVASVLAFFLRAACPRTGGGAQGFTFEKSRGGGWGLGAARFRSVRLANLGFPWNHA